VLVLHVLQELNQYQGLCTICALLAALDFAISFIGVGIFTILTAWDTQKLKSIYYAMNGNTARASNTEVYGALTLYLYFINLFIMLLHFFGIRRSDD
jgi:FtsH-binding integral membrane protein